MNKPIVVGSAILDISKEIVYISHYSYVFKKFGPNDALNHSSDGFLDNQTGSTNPSRSRVKLLFSDTDSVCYYFEGFDDIYEKMREDSEKYFELSDFPKDHKCYSDVNEKRLKYFKDETAGIPIFKFVGLRSNMYSILLEDGPSKNTAKGIQQHFSKTNSKHELYKKCLVEQTKTLAQYNSIRSLDHQLYTIHEKKTALCSYDDKRFSLADSHDTLAYGHYKLPNK